MTLFLSPQGRERNWPLLSPPDTQIHAETLPSEGMPHRWQGRIAPPYGDPSFPGKGGIFPWHVTRRHPVTCGVTLRGNLWVTVVTVTMERFLVVTPKVQQPRRVHLYKEIPVNIFVWMFLLLTWTKATVTTMTMACKKKRSKWDWKRKGPSFSVGQSSPCAVLRVNKKLQTYHSYADSIIKLPHQNTDESRGKQQQYQRILELRKKDILFGIIHSGIKTIETAYCETRKSKGKVKRLTWSKYFFHNGSSSDISKSLWP